MSMTKWIWLFAGLTATALIGIVRYLTGPEWALSLFYLFPILSVTWHVSRRAGVMVCLASALSWLTADLLMLRKFSSPWVPYLNETFRLGVFLVVTWALAKLKQTIEQKDLALEAAMTDVLTGIGNRRSFCDLAGRELSRAARFNRPFSVAYLDLDNFKLVNDTYGHFTGDEVLLQVARAIKNNTRPMDISARLGGDEFAILYPETSAEAAQTVGRRLQAKLLEAMQIRKWPVTFSIGLVTFNRLSLTVDDLLKEADNAMYFAKQTKKNMITYRVIGG